MTAKERIADAMFIVGSIMTLTGAAIYITTWRDVAPYVYTIGAGMVALVQINATIDINSKVLRRLRAQQIIGALLLVLTGFFMVYTHGNEWIVCLAIASVLELYTAFRIPQEEEREKKNNSN